MSMNTPSPCRPEECASWIALLDECFGYQPPESYGVDFAPSFSEAALAGSRVVREAGAIVSGGVMVERMAVTAAGSAKFAALGAIATAEKHRGQGHSRAVMDSLIAAAEDSGAAAALLWSETPEYYTQYGFEPRGAQLLLPLQIVSGDLAGLKPAPGKLAQGWTMSAVRPLHGRHPSRIERSDDLWGEQARITSCTRLEWRAPDGAVAAYMGIGRGKDMAGVIHEWGGSAAGLLAMLQALLPHAPELLWLTHPRLEDPVRELISSKGLALAPQPLALFKPLGGVDIPPALDDIIDLCWFWGLDSV